MTTRIILDLSEEQLAIVDKWLEHYLSPDLPETRVSSLHDMLGRISDDMRDMEEDD